MIVVACGSLNSIVQRCTAWKKSFPWDECYFYCGVWPGDKMCHNTKTGACKDCVYLSNPCWDHGLCIFTGCFCNEWINTSHPILTLFSMLLASSWVMPIKDSLFMAMSWSPGLRRPSCTTLKKNRPTVGNTSLRILLDLWQSRSNLDLRLKHNFNKQQLSFDTFLALYINVIAHSMIHKARWFGLFPIWYSGLTGRILKNGTLFK